MLNIIQNGLVYGEKVHAYAEKTANRIVIVFEDDGPGIPKDQYKNVFKPFIRLDKSRILINRDRIRFGNSRGYS